LDYSPSFQIQSLVVRFVRPPQVGHVGGSAKTVAPLLVGLVSLAEDFPFCPPTRRQSCLPQYSHESTTVLPTGKRPNISHCSFCLPPQIRALSPFPLSPPLSRNSPNPTIMVVLYFSPPRPSFVFFLLRHLEPLDLRPSSEV